MKQNKAKKFLDEQEHKVIVSYCNAFEKNGGAILFAIKEKSKDGLLEIKTQWVSKHLGPAETIGCLEFAKSQIINRFGHTKKGRLKIKGKKK